MPRFLLVDDDPSTVSAIAHLLIDDGHSVLPFTDGGQAVDALSRESFDAVITDLEMPRIDGHAVARAARDRQPSACLVIVTGKPEQAATGLPQGGACLVADKPLDYDEVLTIITECRSRRGRGGHGECHAKSRSHGSIPLQLRRR